MTVAVRDRWMSVEVRHLVALEAIVREGSFCGAADSLGYVQSAVSRQVSNLERMVGVRLIERSRGTAPVGMTPAGRLLMDHVTTILERFQEAHDDLSALAEQRAGTVRVGAFQSVATSLLPGVLPGFTRACPAAEIAPTETLSDEPLFELVEQGSLDVAFCQLPLVDGPFESVELLDDPFVLLASTPSRWVDHGEPDHPTLAEIGRMPLIGFNRSRAQDAVIMALRALGIEPQFAFRSGLNATVQALVAAHLGVAIVPRLSVDPHHPGTIAIELPELPPRRIALIWHRSREPSGAVEQFIDATREACAE